MTKAEFDTQLDEMKRRGHGLVVSAWVVVIALDTALVWWLISYRGHVSNRPAFISSLILMILWGISIGALFFCFKRHAVRYSPKCSVCHKPLTRRQRAQVFASRQCPFCQAQIINEPGA